MLTWWAGGICEGEKSEEVGITQSRRRQLEEMEQRRCRRLELDGFGRALFEEGSCGRDRGEYCRVLAPGGRRRVQTVSSY